LFSETKSNHAGQDVEQQAGLRGQQARRAEHGPCGSTGAQGKRIHILL
jgi:hypothetical protein